MDDSLVNITDPSITHKRDTTSLSWRKGMKLDSMQQN